MGFALGTLTLLIGLFFLVFPGVSAKIFRFGGAGVSYNNLDTVQSKGKYKFGLSPSVDKYYGAKKAVIIFRVLGLIFIIMSIFVYILSP